MAEDRIDMLLRASLTDAAVPASPAGVADLIRGRLAAGETGVSASGPEAPGWAGLGRPGWFWPLVTAVTVLAVVLAVLIGVLLWPAAPAPITTPAPVPSATASPTDSATPTPSPTPTVTEQPDPDPPAPLPPAPVDNPPSISQISADPSTVGCEQGSTVSVIAADDAGVHDVMLSWNGPSSGAAPMTLQGGTWSYVIPMMSGTGTYTITAVARDTAGQASAPATIGVVRDICIT
ncbi:MAG: hypothetical protein ACTHKX_06045 [Pseudolysinimonas sp.]